MTTIDHDSPRLADQERAAAMAAASELFTVRDFVRHGVSRFRAANLSFGHGTTNAYDEAVFMVLEGLHLPIDQLEPYLDARLTGAERQTLADLIAARVITRKPAAYLLNRAYIQGVPFYVDERVIVPRSFIGELLFSGLFGDEDGTLVEDVMEVETVLDLCTGSGCLAILAAQVFPRARIDAVDLSPHALEVARRNVEDSGYGQRINLFQGDLFAPLAHRKYDLILSNPPYVAEDEMAVLPPEYRHEPAMALAAGAEGLDVVERILEAAPRFLNPGGGLLCEVGTGRDLLDEAHPDLPFLWLDTEDSTGEVFWITREELTGEA